MSLSHAILTALAERPGSGFDLAERFDRSIGFYWHATHQHIYRELGRLEEAGWAKSEPVPAARGKKRSYEILPAGRKELRRWIAEESHPQPLRAELMVRLRAEAAVGPAGLNDEVVRTLALHREKLALFLRIEKKDFSGKGLSREQRLRHVVLKAGILHEKLWIDVLKEALQILSEPSSGD